MESWLAKPVMLTGHAACTFEQTAKSLAVNLRFCLFVKKQSHSLTGNHTRISSIFFPDHLTGQNLMRLEIILSPSIGTKSAVEAMILSPLKREELCRPIMKHCVCWRRTHSSYRLEQDCMGWPTLTERTLGYVQCMWHPWRFCGGERHHHQLDKEERN